MVAILNGFGRVLRFSEGLALKLSALLMLALLALMNVEVFARYLFNRSTLCIISHTRTTGTADGSRRSRANS